MLSLCVRVRVRKVVLPKYNNQSFNNFQVAGLSEAVSRVQQLHAGDEAESQKASDTVMAMECLLTTMVPDESDWCTAWSKLLQYVMKHKALPNTLRDLGLEIPRQLHYMLDSGLAKVGVKHELSEQTHDTETSDAASTIKVPNGKKSDGPSQLQRPGHLCMHPDMKS